MEKRDVVIIGGGPAGRSIVHAMKASGRDLKVTLIKNEEINANRCAIPYGISGEKPVEKFQISNKLITDFGGELVIDQVNKIEPDTNQVHTESGKIFEYKHLVISTGSRPVIPPIPGIKAETITAVRSIADLSRLRKFAAKGKRAVVVGGGYIGLEVAVVLKKLGIDVNLVEMLPKILMATTEPEFISIIEDTLAENDLQVLVNKKVVEFVHLSDGTVEVKLESGETLAADFVVLSVGVAPNTKLAAEAGIDTSRLGICADESLRTSVKNIYTCGDCAEKQSFITGQPTRGEFGTNAVFMARAAAQSILGNEVKFPGIINANATVIYEWSVGSAGLTEQMARDAGIDVVTGYSEVYDKYPMMDEVDVVRTKLVFNRTDQKLIGGSVMRKGNGTAQSVDFISLAIQMGTTMKNLSDYQYATHPELAAKPSDNTYTFAAREALSKL
ncbi:MAG: FAD-dependent oxidoreductase [Syntrophobacterales bacterium]|nr:FAD-dependent oxidoreductase [Syntrophobacterales bacterium]